MGGSGGFSHSKTSWLLLSLFGLDDIVRPAGNKKRSVRILRDTNVLSPDPHPTARLLDLYLIAGACCRILYQGPF